MIFNRIKELRTDKDINQKEIAKLLSITQAQYSYIENNKYELDYKRINYISTILLCKYRLPFRNNRYTKAISS